MVIIKISLSGELGTRYWGAYRKEKTLTYLQDITVRFYWIIMVTTQRSVDNFGILIDGVHRSKVIDLEGRGNFSYLQRT